MRKTDQPRAVIYCRVSNKTQTTRGDGLGSQETRCREYAKYKGYTVECVFTDDMSGSITSRPGMQAMLQHLRKNQKTPRIVIIDDISRLARGIEAHLQLRGAIASAGASLESPSIEFGEDSDSILVENLLASVSQHQRQKNSEQTLNRMKARMMNGYWVFQAPIGYRYQRISGRGNVLVRDEPLATIIQEALEGYASGRFQLQAEVKRFLEGFPAYPKDKHGEVRNQRVTELLTRVAYAGYVESEDWGVTLRQGQHEGLINFETYLKIQERLNGPARVPARKNLNEDFPLRGFVTCADCGHPLTAAWSKGRIARHPYYFCFEKGCASYRKSIRRDELEGRFTTLLHRLQPTNGLFKVARAMFEDLWTHRLTSQKERLAALDAEITRTERKIEQLLDRIIEAESKTVIAAYEKRIQDLESTKIRLREQRTRASGPSRGFEESFRTAFEFLSSPWKLWDSERLEDKRAVLKLAFADQLAYKRKEGFRTAKTTLPFKALGDFHGPKNMMARPRGFEPLAFGSGNQRSIQLS